MRKFQMQFISFNPQDFDYSKIEEDCKDGYSYCSLIFLMEKVEAQVIFNENRFHLYDDDLVKFNSSLLNILRKMMRGECASSELAKKYIIPVDPEGELYYISFFNLKEEKYPEFPFFLNRKNSTIHIYSRHTRIVNELGTFLLNGVDSENGELISTQEFITECCNYLDSYHNDLVAAFPGIASDEMYIEAREEITKIRTAF